MGTERQRPVFRLTTALGVSGLLTSGAALAAAIASLHRTFLHAGRFSIASLEFTYPRLNPAGGGLIALAGLGAMALTIALRASWRQRQAFRRFLAGLRVIGPLPQDPAITVIADPHPQAFCAGYLRPEIYVSEPTLRLLGEDELEAVLAHEREHQRVHDPLRFVCARILAQALFFLPALAPLGRRYEELAELGADAAAGAAVGRGPLARALLALEASSPLPVAGFSGERVDSLLGQRVRPRLPLGRLGVSAAALAGLAAFIWRSSRFGYVHATLNLPIVSPRPCIAVTLALPLVAWARRLTR
jgi:Peptidase family M48